MSVQANQPVDIHIRTSKNSLVFLTISDQIVADINLQNEINNSDIYKQLIYYLNLKFSNNPNYYFEHFNGFIMQPLQTGTSCDQESEPEQNTDVTVLENSNFVSQFYSNVWFDKSFDIISDQTKLINVEFPNSFTIPKYYGISIHPEKGFALAKIDNNVEIYSTLIVTVTTPSFAFTHETIWIIVTIYNDADEDQIVEISLNIENGYIVNQTDEIECLNIQKTSETRKTEKVTVSSEATVELMKIPVLSDGNDSMKIRVVLEDRSREYLNFIEIKQFDNMTNLTENLKIKVDVQDIQEIKSKISIDINPLKPILRPNTLNRIMVKLELPRGDKYIMHEESDNIKVR